MRPEALYYRVPEGGNKTPAARFRETASFCDGLLTPADASWVRCSPGDVKKRLTAYTLDAPGLEVRGLGIAI